MSSRDRKDTRKPSGPQGPDTPDHPDSQPDNAFSEEFLEAFGKKDQPPTTEADTTGPWVIRRVEGGWGVFAPSAEAAEAVLVELELALLCAAAFPPSGADERLRFADTGERPFPLEMLGQRVGWMKWFREDLVAAMNHLLALLRRPDCLAYLLEAAGSLTLERAGAILAARLEEMEP